MESLQRIIAGLGENQDILKKTLQEQLEKMQNLSNEVRDDWTKVQEDMMQVFQGVKEQNVAQASDIKHIKDVALHSRIMLEDLKYKVF